MPRSENSDKVYRKVPIAYCRGQAQAESLIDISHLFYQRNTQRNFWMGLLATIRPFLKDIGIEMDFKRR